MQRFFPLLIIVLVIIFSFAVSIPGSPFLINGMTQKAISDMYFTAITPAGITFSIWSVIYLSWLVIGILIAMKKISLPKSPEKNFLTAVVLSAVWMIPWSFLKIEIAFIFMISILCFLWATFFEIKNSPKNYFRMVVELFMGWIHIAFFAHLAVLLHYFGLVNSPENMLLIGQIIFAIAGLATLYFQIFHKTYIVSLVFLWASFGIYMAQNPSIIIYEILAFCVAVAISMIFSIIIKNKKLWTTN